MNDSRDEPLSPTKNGSTQSSMTICGDDDERQNQPMEGRLPGKRLFADVAAKNTNISLKGKYDEDECAKYDFSPTLSRFRFKGNDPQDQTCNRSFIKKNIQLPGRDINTENDDLNLSLTSDEEQLMAEAADEASDGLPSPSKSRKVARTDAITTPGKQRWSNIKTEELSPELLRVTSNTSSDDIFAPRPASTEGYITPGSHLDDVTAEDTPSLSSRFRTSEVVRGESGKFAIMDEVLALLKKDRVPISVGTRRALEDVLERHAMKAEGIAKGYVCLHLAIYLELVVKWRLSGPSVN